MRHTNKNDRLTPQNKHQLLEEQHHKTPKGTKVAGKCMRTATNEQGKTEYEKPRHAMPITPERNSDST